MESSIHVGRETTSLESELRIASESTLDSVFTQQDDPGRCGGAGGQAGRLYLRRAVRIAGNVKGKRVHCYSTFLKLTALFGGAKYQLNIAKLVLGTGCPLVGHY